VTWLRWDTVAPTSDVVGHLADGLGVELAHAFGLYVACCLGFGEHAPAGRPGDVTDATLEQWALWRGKRGRFAAAFRGRCIGPDGVIRGWDRQARLLERQERNAKHRKPSTNRHETVTPLRRESAVDVDDDGNGTGTEQTETSSAPREARHLVNALGRDPDRFAVMALFDHLPPEETVPAWSGIMLSCLQGGMQGGRSASVQQLAVACADFPALAKGKWVPRYFRACVQRVMDGNRAPVLGGKTDKMLADTQAWTPPEAA